MQLQKQTQVTAKAEAAVGVLEAMLLSSEVATADDLVRTLRNARRKGVFSERPAMADLMIGMAKSLGGKRQVFTPAQRSFFSYLLCVGGPRSAVFASANMGGPKLGSMRIHRKLHFNFNMTNIPNNLKQLMPMLTELNLKSLPMVLSEDNSKVQPRIDIVLEDGKVTAYGCNGDKFVVELSPDEVLDMVVGHGLATDIYVVALAPMGRHAPFYPIVAHPNNSANDTLSRAKILELRSQACAAVRDADLYVLGVATDSDAHCRLVAMAAGLPKASGVTEQRAGKVAHPLMEMRTHDVTHNGQTFEQFFTFDFVHNVWRIKHWMLNKELCIGDFKVLPSHLQAAAQAAGIRGGVPWRFLDAHNKQDWEGCMFLADLVWDDKKNCAAETTQLRDQLAKMPEARGTLTYVQWMHDYLSIFTVPLEPEEVIKRASNVIASLGFWDALIRRELDTAKADHVPPRYNFERNYMPLQTKQDVIVSCNQIINALQLLRRYSDSMGELFKLDASRVSSRWCEYTFQFLRCCDRTSTTFGTLAAKQRMSIVLGQMMLECSSDLEFQRAKRGAPRGKASAYASLGDISLFPEYFPSDALMAELVEEGVEQARTMLRKRVLIDGKPVVLWEQLIKPSSCKYGSTHIRLLQDVSLAPIAAVPQSAAADGDDACGGDVDPDAVMEVKEVDADEADIGGAQPGSDDEDSDADDDLCGGGADAEAAEAAADADPAAAGPSSAPARTSTVRDTRPALQRLAEHVAKVVRAAGVDGVTASDPMEQVIRKSATARLYLACCEMARRINNCWRLNRGHRLLDRFFTAQLLSLLGSATLEGDEYVWRDVVAVLIEQPDADGLMREHIAFGTIDAMYVAKDRPKSKKALAAEREAIMEGTEPPSVKARGKASRTNSSAEGAAGANLVYEPKARLGSNDPHGWLQVWWYKAAAGVELGMPSWKAQQRFGTPKQLAYMHPVHAATAEEGPNAKYPVRSVIGLAKLVKVSTSPGVVMHLLDRESEKTYAAWLEHHSSDGGGKAHNAAEPAANEHRAKRQCTQGPSSQPSMQLVSHGRQPRPGTALAEVLLAVNQAQSQAQARAARQLAREQQRAEAEGQQQRGLAGQEPARPPAAAAHAELPLDAEALEAQGMVLRTRPLRVVPARH